MVTESSTSSERMIERELMVTGEAVALEVIPATAVNRMMSGIIDYTTYSLGGLLSVLALMALILGTGPESALAGTTTDPRTGTPRPSLCTESSAPGSCWPGWSSSPCSLSCSVEVGAWAVW